MTVPTTDFPLLVAAPGMTFTEVQTQSQVGVGLPRNSKGFRAAYPTKPHQLRFQHEKCGFTLPPSCFAFLEGVDGCVQAIRTSPQLSYTNGPQSVELVNQCRNALEEAHWTAVSSFLGNDVLQRMRYGGDAIAQNWKFNGFLCQIRLKRVHTPDSKVGRLLQVNEDQMLVNLFIAKQELFAFG